MIRRDGGVGGGTQAGEIREFADFISNGNLLDVKLHGRSFTWYRSNGKSKSRIDRALVNEKWMRSWPNPILRALPRSVSDHCAIMLDPISRDWGGETFPLR